LLTDTILIRLKLHGTCIRLNKHVCVYLFVLGLLISGIAGPIFLCNHAVYGGARAQRNKTQVIQADDPILNNTDYNVTIGQTAPNLSVTIAPRIVTEYGDYASTQSLNSNIPSLQASPRIITEYAESAPQLILQSPQGLSSNGVTPRIIVEYAEHVTFIGLPLQSYQGPDISPTVSILSPENMTYNNVTSVPLTFSVDQTTSWMGYSLDGQPTVTISGNLTLTGLTYYAHNVIVFANNSANVMGASNTMFFTTQTVPEFTTMPIILLFLMATLLVILIRTRKRSKIFAI
jgi:hypothetical protein